MPDDNLLLDWVEIVCDDGARTPGAGETHTCAAYFPPHVSTVGENLLLSFDFLHFDPLEESDAMLKLVSVWLRSIGLPAVD